MPDNEEYKKIVEDLLDKSKDEILEGVYDVAKNAEKLPKKKKFDLTRQFSVINLPSQGKFYSNKKKRILIKYLTAHEEHVLTDIFLVESGIGIEMVLDNLIIDEDVQSRDLLLSDFQALLIFLRSTAFGDKVELPVVCPFCKRESDYEFYLSQLDFRENASYPNNNGEFEVLIDTGEKKFDVRLKPITFGHYIDQEDDDDEKNYIIYNDGQKEIKIKKERTIKMLNTIKSMNGHTDKERIRKMVNSLPKSIADELNEVIKDNEVGVREETTFICPYCSEESKHKISLGYNFISLPESYKENIMEECFLITYYGKGITYQDSVNMPVFVRKWHIRRIKKEVDKQSAAENSAAAKGKSGSGYRPSGTPKISGL